MVDRGLIMKLDHKLSSFKEAIALIRKMKQTHDLNLFNIKKNVPKITINKKENYINYKNSNNLNLSTPKNYTTQHIEKKLTQNTNINEEKVIDYKLLHSTENNSERIKSLTFPKINQNSEKKSVLRKDLQINVLYFKAENNKKEKNSIKPQSEVNLKVVSDTLTNKNISVGILTDLYNEYIKMSSHKPSFDIKIDPYLTPSNISKEITTNIGFKKSIVKKDPDKKNRKLAEIKEIKRPKNKLVINNSNKALDMMQLHEVDTLIIPSSNNYKKNKKVSKHVNTEFINYNVKKIESLKLTTEEIYKVPESKDLSPWVVHDNED